MNVLGNDDVRNETKYCQRVRERRDVSYQKKKIREIETWVRL